MCYFRNMFEKSSSSSITRRTLIGGAAIGAGLAITGSRANATARPRFRELRAALDAVHRAGVPGVFAAARAGRHTWRGAAGVADRRTGRPATPDLRHRVGSLTKTFTAVAVLRLAERGRLSLDAPVGRYLPGVVPGERGDRITVRMLLNHTSGLPDYLPYAFPSLQTFPAAGSTRSLDDNRHRRFGRAELIAMGVGAPAADGVYSNTNYLLLGELLEAVTGTPAEQHITRAVIEPAGLRDTGFPAGEHIVGAHPRMYESFFGLIDPPRDYSVYDMSWVSTGAALVSTLADVNRFYGMLLGGRIVGAASLEQMRVTVPVVSQTGERIDYGLGLHRFTVDGAGPVWGHDGTVWGAQTMTMVSADGERQLSVATNLARWNSLTPEGRPQPHPIDEALSDLYRLAMRD